MSPHQWQLQTQRLESLKVYRLDLLALGEMLVHYQLQAARQSHLLVAARDTVSRPAPKGQLRIAMTRGQNWRICSFYLKMGVLTYFLSVCPLTCFFRYIGETGMEPTAHWLT